MSATNGFLSKVAQYSVARDKRSPDVTASPEDDALMLRIQRGDDDALGMLFQRYAGMVLGIGLRVLRDREEAEELVQDVFFAVYKKCGLYDRNRGSARAWLVQTAYNRAFDRREYLQVRRFYDSRGIEESTEAIRGSCDVEYQARLHQEEEILRRAFEDLTDKQRKTLTLFFFEGYTLREISKELNETLPNIRHYYYRGLKHLKENTNISSLTQNRQR